MTMSNNRGTRVAAAGFSLMLFAASAGIGFGDEFSVLLGLLGVLVGATSIAVAIGCTSDEPAATPTTSTLAFARLGALAAFLRRNLAVLGLILASSAVRAIAGGETEPVLCCVMFALLLLGLCLIYVRVLVE